MKRILGIALALASLGWVEFASEARAADLSPANVTLTANANPQMAQWERDRYGRRIYNRRVRTIRRTRVVRYGRRVYRETYVVRYLPNGMTNARIISRVRIA